MELARTVSQYKSWSRKGLKELRQLLRLHGVQEVAGSNPVAPTLFPFGENVEGLSHFRVRIRLL